MRTPAAFCALLLADTAGGLGRGGLPFAIDSTTALVVGESAARRPFGVGSRVGGQVGSERRGATAEERQTE